MNPKQPKALAQECADYATSLRSTINVVKLEGREPPISFLRAAELFERAAARIAELEARMEVDARHPYDGIDCRDATIAELQAGYDAARLEIASLQARVQQLGQLARDVNSRRVMELEAQLAAVGAECPSCGAASEVAGFVCVDCYYAEQKTGELSTDYVQGFAHGQATLAPPQPAAARVATDSDDALMAREMYESQDDSLLLCASDLQHSAIYDNHIEMQSCIRAVADRITALASVIAGVERAALAAPAPPDAPVEAHQLHGDAKLAHDQCRAVVSLASSVAEVYAARAAIVEHDNSLADLIGYASAAAMEWLGDEMNAMDAATEEDEWIDPIFDAAQERWPQPSAALPDAREKLRTDVARAIWEVMREYEDSCDLALEDLGSSHQVWFCADAAIAAKQGGA